MPDRFTRHLKDFARTVDYVDKSTLEQIEGSFYDYMKGALAASYYEICVPGVVMGETDIPTLKTKWCMIGDRREQNITLRENDTIRSHKAFCFLENTVLWVTPKDESSLLRECSSSEALHIEGMNEGISLESLPAYRDYEVDGTGESKTAVCCPLFHERTTLGLALVELPRIVSHTRVRREHFQDLTDSLAKILARHRTSVSSLADTKDAYKDLIRSVNYEDCGLPDEKPTIFFSYPADCDDFVVRIVKQVIGEHFGDRLELIDWAEISESGSITSQVIERIRTSRFGICYLSEKIAGIDNKYQDNPNVLFEAGMFHMLRSNRADSLHGWLPIREAEDLCGEVPFNFANERILNVPRAGTTVDESQFEEKLRAFIEDLIDA